MEASVRIPVSAIAGSPNDVRLPSGSNPRPGAMTTLRCGDTLRRTMRPGPISRPRLARRCSLAALALSCLLAPGAAAIPARPGQDNLSSRLAQLSKPGALRSMSLAQAGERLALSPEGPGSLLREGNRLVVEVRFDSGARESVDALRAAGARVMQVTPSLQTVTVAVAPSELRAIGALPRVAAVTEVLTPETHGVICQGSGVVSEGDGLLNAPSARANFGLDGSGVTVGILSDSFDRSATAVTHAGVDIVNGDLPGPGGRCGSEPVRVLDDHDTSGEDEGRAMLQIVHDLAPGASLDFASASGGIANFAANIRALANAGSSVIADDVGYSEEAFFQEGPVAEAATEVTAKGIPYLSAAGNENKRFAEHDVGSWESPSFRDAGSCPPQIVELSEEIEEEEKNSGVTTPAGLNPSHCEDFSSGPGADRTFGIVVEPGATLEIDLQWAQPWFGVHDDLDAFLQNSTGILRVAGKPVMATEDNIGTSQKPLELLNWTNPGDTNLLVELVINHDAGSGAPPLKVEMMGDHGVASTEYPQSEGGDTVGPTIFGQPGAASTIGVGAVPYSNTATAEEFSSRGPVTHYFAPVVGTSPALPIVPQVIAKPDVAGIDGGATSFFSQQERDGTWRFFGTSAATPHIAAIVALMRQANPGATPAQLRAALRASGRPVGAFGPTVIGGGLVDALAAIKAIALPPKITVTSGPAGPSRNRNPVLQFLANRPVSFRCTVDSGPAQACSSPFTVGAALNDGPHSVTVSGVDAAGREGNARVAFTVDTKAPQTSIVAHPRSFAITHRRKYRAKFRFRSDEQGVTFGCKLDRGGFAPCSSTYSPKVSAGRHVLKVRAQDAAGNVDPTPAVFHFVVRRIG
jgi:hypothetical protein